MLRSLMQRVLVLRSFMLAALLLALLLWGLNTRLFSRAQAQVTAQVHAEDAAELSPSSVLSAAHLITVTTFIDEVNNDGNCSLREALNAAATDTVVDACAAGNAEGDGGDTLYLPAGTYALTAGQISLTGYITLQGSLSATTILDAQRLGRVISITTSAVVVINHLDIRNGKLPIDTYSYETTAGAGIYNLGTATISHTAIHGNSAGYYAGSEAGESEGGGIFNAGSMRIAHSVIYANKAGTYGGGGTGASGSNGGGIYNAGIMTVTNSTISGNKGGTGSLGPSHGGQYSCGRTGEGGGVANVGTLTLNHVTVAANIPGTTCVEYLDQEGRPGKFGGVANSGILTIKNSIIAGNEGSDCFGTLTSLGNNLLQTMKECTIQGDYFTWPPYLKPLADYGGPTLTHALSAKSPAINAGDCLDSANQPIGVDQRGEVRPQGTGCDIGAFESPDNPTFAIITTTLPNITLELVPCTNITTPCNLTYSPNIIDRNPVWSPDGQRIAYVRVAEGYFPAGENDGIYVMNSDGSGLELLVARGDHPTWSPDGRQIAFDSNIDGNSEIYRIAITGGTSVNLTNSPSAHEDTPVWSPDGSMIAFSSSSPASPRSVRVMKADGSQNIQLGDGFAFGGWSPDSSRVALNAPLAARFHTIATDGSNLVSFGSSSQPVFSPAWSPDGTKIAYACVFTTPSPYMPRLCISDNNESNLQIFNMEDRTLEGPSWSPDGSTILFTCLLPSAGEKRICTTMSDGSGMRQFNDSDFYFYQWSPDGKRILVAEYLGYSSSGGIYAHFVMDAAGTNRQRLFDLESNEMFYGVATWSPDGSKILFAKAVNGKSDLFVLGIE